MIGMEIIAELVDDVAKRHYAVTSAAAKVNASTDGFRSVVDAIRAEGAAILTLQDALPGTAPEPVDVDERREAWRQARELGL